MPNTTVREYLDWSDRSHWNGGHRAPCRCCGKPAFLLDDEGRPAHKTCVEAEQRQQVA